MSYPPDTNTQKSSLVTHLLDAKPVTSLEDHNTGTRKKRKLKKFKPRLKNKEGVRNQNFIKDTAEEIQTEGRPIHEKAKVFPTKPSLVLRDYFGTPFPLKSSDTSTSERDFVKPILPLPLVVSNDIGTKNFDKNSIFETLKSLTGATPVGVTNEVTYHDKDDKIKKSKPLKKNIVSRDNTKELDSEVSSAHDSDAVQNQRGHHSRQDYARQLSGPAPNSRTSRRKSQQKVVTKDVHKVDESDRKAHLNSDAIIQPSKPRKGKKKSKRNKFRKATINTVERYRYENEDGSITWGYMNEDGGFKVLLDILILELKKFYSGGDNRNGLHYSWKIWVHRPNRTAAGVLLYQRTAV